MARLTLVTLFLLMWNISAGAQCFAPLEDSSSTKTSDWKDLVKFTQSVQETGVIRSQPIASGYGDKINLDYYSITFRKHPTRSLSEVFRDIRRHFNSFAHEGETVFEEPAEFSVVPYRGTSSRDDQLATRNNSLWGSANPQHAVMSFILSSYTPAIARVSATARGITVVKKKASVVTTCATSTDFIFSTVKTEKDGYHPVNGNRGFGIKDNKDGTWTFYTMGADREGMMDLGVEYVGNHVLHLGLVEGIPKGPDAVFQAGHIFWVHFFTNLMGYLDRVGMTVNYASFVKNSHRYPYQP
jgi:hypothetical protein